MQMTCNRRGTIAYSLELNSFICWDIDSIYEEMEVPVDFTNIRLYCVVINMIAMKHNSKVRGKRGKAKIMKNEAKGINVAP